MAARSESERERLRRISILNARLPRKRTIAQGLLRDPRGRVLVCELSYKKEWDLPGGVVDPGESPATCVEREVQEELGIEVRAGRLLAVNWLPPWRGWDDALLYLFDLGVHESGELDPALFLRREIAGAHWLHVPDAAPHVASYTARMLEVAADAEHPAYLENSEPVGPAGSEAPPARR
ncbi:MAG TPA: NUDIX hydrolase [Ornithinibacter sp.]|nr:NUDIX hydrolase [Ornithinibacter sp.]